MVQKLPIIGEPPIQFFTALQTVELVVQCVLVSAASWSLIVLMYLVIFDIILKQRRCCRWIKTLILFVGRFLCVNMFPALFKKHKVRSDSGRQATREFMVFLDRKVEKNLALIAAFCSIIFIIFSTSAIVFFRYFLVEESEECREKDNHDRPVFCYDANGYSSSSRLPMDCANLTDHELHELTFQCYALPISIPGIGIAVAAALALTKVAIVGVTCYIKVTVSFYKMARNPPLKLTECCPCCSCCNGRLCITGYVIINIVLFIIGFESFVVNPVQVPYLVTVPNYVYYIAYGSLLMLLGLPLIFIIILLVSHCKQGEYVSLTADQRPLQQRDWDVESELSASEEQQDESVANEQALGESGNSSGASSNETEEEQLLESNTSTRSGYGAIQA